MTKKKMPKLRDGFVPVQFLTSPENWAALQLGIEVEGSVKGENYLQTDFIHDALREKLASLGIEFGDPPPRGAAAQQRNKNL